MRPHERQSGAVKAICEKQTEIYEKARQANSTRWIRSTCSWRQPEDMWINKAAEEAKVIQVLTSI
jgi:hypothetical protein